MDFINQGLEVPKKPSLSSLGDSYQEISLQEMLYQQQSLNSSELKEGERRLVFGKKDPLEKERESLEQAKKLLEEEKNLLHEKLQSFEKMLQAQKGQMEEWKQEAVQHFSEVVFKIAEAVLREELQLKPERLKDLILNLVQKTHGESEKKLLLHPNNLQWMKEKFPDFVLELESKYQIVVKEEESVQENSFIFETSLHQYQENPFLNIEWLKKELYHNS
ncbi:MAG: hypothetical protein HQM15_04775 [Deltaproteobacteria bacterium]|nr:hypothetical protein [Deltaproteobacteria bacterium]